MGHDEWRIRIDLGEEEGAGGLLERLGRALGGTAQELARDLEGRRLAVSRDGDRVYVYAASRWEADQARRIVEAELGEHRLDGEITIEQWLDDEERWSDELPEASAEEELLEHGYAPWEVRVECRSQAEARELADELEREGYGVVRRFHYVIAGTATRDEARELARRVHGDVEPGGELVWETIPQNPFAVFLGGMGGSGTPL